MFSKLIENRSKREFHYENLIETYSLIVTIVITLRRQIYKLKYNLLDTDKLKIINKNSLEHISNSYSGINNLKILNLIDIEFK